MGLSPLFESCRSIFSFSFAVCCFSSNCLTLSRDIIYVCTPMDLNLFCTPIKIWCVRYYHRFQHKFRYIAPVMNFSILPRFFFTSPLHHILPKPLAAFPHIRSVNQNKTSCRTRHGRNIYREVLFSIDNTVLAKPRCGSVEHNN